MFLKRLILVLLLLCFSEARETQWGFDGRVVAGRMNLLSVRPANPAHGNLDGMLKLCVVSGIDPRARIEFVEILEVPVEAE